MSNDASLISMLGDPGDAEMPSVPAAGWALELEIDTHFDSRDGIAAQLEEIARQIRRGTTGGRGNGSGGSHAWKLTSKAPNERLSNGGGANE